MPKYKGVTRVITLFIYEDRRGVTHIDVTPDPAKVIVGDTIQWEVQGAPPGVTVKIGELVRTGPPPGIHVKRPKCTVQEKTIISPDRLKMKPSNTTIVATDADIGCYKYDIFFDSVKVLDPDIEIKGRPG